MASNIILNNDAEDAVVFRGTSLTKVMYNTTTVWERTNAPGVITSSTTKDNYIPFTSAVDTPFIMIESPGNYTIRMHGTTADIVERSWDGIDWEKVSSGYAYIGGGAIYIRFKSSSTVPHVELTGDIVSIRGNLAALANYDTMDGTGYDFNNVFGSSTALFDASGLVVDGTIALAEALFADCTALKYAPLSMGSADSSPFFKMAFMRCASLVTVPELPATTLVESCYDFMFDECSSLTYAPELPATTLSKLCYSGMFSSCTSLVSVPALKASALVDFCYDTMFYGCSALTSLEIDATDIGDPYTTCNGMLDGVASAGVLKHSSAWNTTESEFKSGTSMPDTWTFDEL